MNSGLPASAAALGGAAVPCAKVKLCRYYAKDKTCFYGDECQFLHEEPSAAGLSAHGSASGPAPLALSSAAGTAAYPLGGSASTAAGANVPKKNDSVGAGGALLDGQLLSRESAGAPMRSDAGVRSLIVHTGSCQYCHY